MDNLLPNDWYRLIQTSGILYNSKRKCELLPRENVTHYQEEVWVITKRKCGLLPRKKLTHYQDEM